MMHGINLRKVNMFKFRKDIDFDEDMTALGRLLKAGIIFVLITITFVAITLAMIFWSLWFILGIPAFWYVLTLVDWDETLDLNEE